MMPTLAGEIAATFLLHAMGTSGATPGVFVHVCKQVNVVLATDAGQLIA